MRTRRSPRSVRRGVRPAASPSGSGPRRVIWSQATWEAPAGAGEAGTMPERPGREELPLLSRTPDAWAAMAMRDPLALLSDHAYLEKKAAANALELLNRWPEPTRPEEWTQTLAAIAGDETAHLGGVLRLLTDRGGRLERAHRNDYARA